MKTRRIYEVSAKKHTYLNLWKTGKYSFRIIQMGELLPLLIGYNYVLIRKNHYHIFAPLSKDEVEVFPTTISRKVTEESWDDYYELQIKHTITPDTINSPDLEGEHLWVYGHCLFVSDFIKNQLAEALPHQLTFSLGFSMFAG